MKGGTNRIDLHEALLKQYYDHGVICTFGFDPYFFEKDCLDKLRALSHNVNLSVLVDRRTYDEIVERSGSDRPAQANLRYLLHPVSPYGVFHPKIFLFASRNRGRLIFGSANFTRMGLHSNAELVGCYDYEAEEDESIRPLFRSVFAFIRQVSERWSGETLASNLRTMAAEAEWLLANEEDDEETDYELLHNLDAPLWEQLTSRIVTPVETLSFISRYFDQSPAIMDRIYRDLKPKRIRIYTQNNTTTLTPEYLSHPLVKKGTVEIFLCAYKDINKDKEQHQNLHAKAVAVAAGEETLFAFGSANCTTPALMSTAGTGNVEVLLLLRGLKKRALNIEKLFDPNQTAVRLRDMDALQSERNEPLPPPTQRKIRLFEVILNEKVLRLRAHMPDNVAYERLEVVFTLPDDSKASVPVEFLREESYAGNISDKLFQKLTESTSVARLQALNMEETIATSNGALVTYLQDIRTGRSLKHERSLREAQQSPSRLLEIYSDLLAEGDEDAAKNFLDSFNVRITDLPIPVIFRALRPVWETDRALVMIRGRPWRNSNTVYEAVVSFFDRHYKRLGRHVDNSIPDGIPNFMHILLTTAVVLQAQIEQGVEGLKERANTPLRPDEWSRQRDLLASYFRRYKELLARLTQEYISPMSRKYPVATIRENLAPEADALRSLNVSILKLHEQLESLRIGKLRVESVPGRLAVPPLFSSLFNEREWAKYAREVESALSVMDIFTV